MQISPDAAIGETGVLSSSASFPFDPLSPEFRQDPYPYYRRLREEQPVFEFRPGMYYVTRYDDCWELLRDQRRFSNDHSKSALYTSLMPGPRGVRELGAKVGAGGGLVMRDPPDHTRLRGLLQQAFTNRTSELMRPSIQEHVNWLLDRMADEDGVDLVQAFAHLLPLWVVCQLLGVPSSDWELLMRWSEDLAPTLEWVVMSQDQARKAYRATRELRLYLARRVEERIAQPRADLITGLIAAELEGSKLTRGELIALSMNLVTAGHDLTANLISNAVLALLRHPDQLELFMDADHAQVRTAVDEFLRYDSPAQLIPRTVVEDVEIRGQAIESGHHVVAVVGSANRDPEHFPDPDRLLIAREDNRHLAFGAGIHRCIGAPLAHIEAQIALPSLFRRFPKIRLATDRIELREAPLIWRGPKRLPVGLR